MLNPSDSIVDWVLKTVPAMGARAVPAGMLGIGIAAPPKAMLIAKEALMEDIDMYDLRQRGPANKTRYGSSFSTRSMRSASALGAGRPVRRARRQDQMYPTTPRPSL
jgi:tartrate dehydratase alpha subunit/fumarate hydratase class I-like protein